MTEQAISPSVTTQAITPSVAAQAINPSVTAQAITPSVTAQAINPSVTAQAINPSVTAQAINPSVTAQAINPSVTAQAINPSVTAQAIARESGAAQRLVGYATLRSTGGPPDGDDLRRFLRERLPDYMVPARIVLIDEMPLTPSKKIDRKALPDPDTARPDLKTAFAAPRDALEAVLAKWFADALRVERVGIVDNFFDLGGDSLMATRIVSQLHDAFRAELTIPELFRAATVAALAELARAALPAGEADRIADALRRVQRMSAAEKRALLSRGGL